MSRDFQLEAIGHMYVKIAELTADNEKLTNSVSELSEALMYVKAWKPDVPPHIKELARLQGTKPS